MTALIKIEKGVQVAHEMECLDCAAWVCERGEDWGLCNNERSDHFAHVVYFKHPACEAFVTRAVLMDDCRKGDGFEIF